MKAIELIAAERKRQIKEEGFSIGHDDNYGSGQLADAAAVYAADRKWRSILGMMVMWPWGASWWRPSANDRIRELVKAGALIVAEIERLQRLEEQK